MNITVPINRLSQTWSNQVNSAIDRSLDEVLHRVILRTPVLTGNLQESWERNDNTITNTADYASYVEDGTIYQKPVGMLKTTLLEFNRILSHEMEK